MINNLAKSQITSFYHWLQLAMQCAVALIGSGKGSRILASGLIGWGWREDAAAYLWASIVQTDRAKRFSYPINPSPWEFDAASAKGKSALLTAAITGEPIGCLAGDRNEIMASQIDILGANCDQSQGHIVSKGATAVVPLNWEADATTEQSSTMIKSLPHRLFTVAARHSNCRTMCTRLGAVIRASERAHHPNAHDHCARAGLRPHFGAESVAL